jgi:tetratricopeptide (TPR) repeat protein
MIVRDEEAVLATALESARHLVDEIIVCDTGSTDGTMALARSFGAQVVEFPWCDDFSAARNAALKAAGGQWILILDADEELAPIDRDELQRLLDDPLVAGYQLTLTNPEGPGYRDFPIVRLFRNDPAVRYRFPVHEQIVPSLNTWAAGRGLSVAASPLVIRHSGYQEDKRAAKRPRNRRLLEKAVADHPDEPYLHFQLGGESVSLLDGEVLPRAGMLEATVSLETAWRLTAELDDDEKRSRTWLADLAALLGSALMVAGQGEQAWLVLQEGGRLFPEDSRLAFLGCLVDPPDFPARANGLPDPWRHRVLGELSRRQGQPDQAIDHFRQALSLSSEYSLAMSGIADCLADQGSDRDALAWYLKAVKASEWNWRAWLAGSRLMTRLGLTEQAGNWRATFVSHFPDHPQAREHTS